MLSLVALPIGVGIFKAVVSGVEALGSGVAVDNLSGDGLDVAGGALVAGTYGVILGASQNDPFSFFISLGVVL